MVRLERAGGLGLEFPFGAPCLGDFLHVFSQLAAVPLVDWLSLSLPWFRVHGVVLNDPGRLVSASASLLKDLLVSCETPESEKSRKRRAQHRKP